MTNCDLTKTARKCSKTLAWEKSSMADWNAVVVICVAKEVQFPPPETNYIFSSWIIPASIYTQQRKSKHGQAILRYHHETWEGIVDGVANSTRNFKRELFAVEMLRARCNADGFQATFFKDSKYTLLQLLSKRAPCFLEFLFTTSIN